MPYAVDFGEHFPGGRMSLTTTLRQAKLAGLTAAKVYETLERKYLRSAKRDHWRPSELAATLTDVAFDLRKVYGKRATRFLFEDRDKK